jgi:tetratricopeptide (TPR) repeat protein
MSYFQSTYHSKVYRDFKEIEPTAYRQIIHFYEEKEAEIRCLEFDEYFDLLIAYVDALFEIGAYQKHLLMVDVIIENSILHNIQFRNGTDIYQRTLFKKAASLYNVLKYEEADYILRELIRMDPYDSDSVLFLKKCLRSKKPQLVINARAASIFLFLLTAFVICIEVLFIRPFYHMHTELVETSRIGIFLLGCILLVGGDLLHRWSVEKEVSQFVDQIKREKHYQ